MPVYTTPEYLPRSIKELATVLYVYCRTFEKCDQPESIARTIKALCIVCASDSPEDDKRFKDAIKAHCINLKDALTRVNRGGGGASPVLIDHQFSAGFCPSNLF